MRFTICDLSRFEYDLNIAISNRPSGWLLSPASLQERRQLP